MKSFLKLVIGGCRGSRWCRVWEGRGPEKSLCHRPGQEMSQCFSLLGPLKAGSVGPGASAWEWAWERGAGAGSPAVIYGGTGNEVGWQ